MKKLFKQITSITILCALLLASMKPMWTVASEPLDEANINQILLESMLHGNRQWVIDTLVEDNYQGNPMAIANHTAHEKSLARQALDNYYGIDVDGGDNRAAYRSMVNAMYFAYNTDEYTKGFFDTLGELLSWAVGLITGDEVKAAAENLNRTRREIHYDNLLESVFTAQYTASDGTTLLDSEANLLTLQDLNSTLKFLKSFNSYTQTYLQSTSDITQWNEVNTEYLEEYGIPYMNAVNGVLSSLPSAGGYDETAATKLGSNLALVAHLSSKSVSSGYSGFS